MNELLFERQKKAIDEITDKIFFFRPGLVSHEMSQMLADYLLMYSYSLEEYLAEVKVDLASPYCKELQDVIEVLCANEVLFAWMSFGSVDTPRGYSIEPDEWIVDSNE